MAWEIREGDCRELLAALEPESVQMVVTSPPYWGLRDYDLPPSIWGADPECDHDWGDQLGERATAYNGKDRWAHAGVALPDTRETRVIDRGRVCVLCGAWRGCLGLEPTPDLFVAHLVEVMAGVHRALRDDGTLWLNLGDSYTSGGRDWRAPDSKRDATGQARAMDTRADTPPGLKPKDLVMIPARVALALQAWGWYLRSDTIWAKPNPMPESVRDRPTRSHEYLFLLSKSPRYYYDADAIREGDSGKSSGNGFERGDHRISLGTDGQPEQWLPGGGRNKRSVWTVATRPYPEAHFATFPPDLVEPCVLAGAPPKCCGACGTPWARVTERRQGHAGNSARAGRPVEEIEAGGRGAYPGEHTTLKAGPVVDVHTLGWEASCDHDDGSARSLVLDPFGGAGTTLLVSERLGRDSIGFELNPGYAEQARDRIRRWEANPNGHLESAPEPVAGQSGLFDD